MNSLEKDLKTLHLYKNNILIKLALNKSYRNWGFVHEFFGVPLEDQTLKSKPLDNINKNIAEFTSIIETKLREKYEQQRTNIAGETDSAGNQNQNSGTTVNRDRYHIGDVSREPETIQPPDNTTLRNDSAFIPKFPDQKAELTTQESHGCDQLTTAQRLFDNIHYNNYRGQQLIAPPGAGKTFILGSVLRNLIHQGYLKNCLSPWPILWTTYNSVVPQNKSELEEFFNLDCDTMVHVVNIEQLRSKLLGTLIEELTVVEYGQPRIIYRWRPGFQPAVIITDESQALARPESLQSQIANSIFTPEFEAFNLWKTYFIDSSATPWTRICEAKHFALATGKKLQDDFGERKINALNWSVFSNDLAGRYTNPDGTTASPMDYHTGAIKEFVKLYEDRIVWVKDVKPKHPGKLQLMRIEFENDKLKEEYDKAEEAHLKRKARIESNSELSAQQQYVSILASYTIFTKAAENCRRYFLARKCHEDYISGFAPAVCFRFKQTGTNIVRILIEDFNWKREDISMIWGGATETLNAKKKLALKIKGNSDALELLEDLDIDLERDFGIDLAEFTSKTEEQLQFERDNDLLSQTPETREREKRRFLRQDTRALLMSYKSGGVGLSAHHQSKYPKALPRRGYFTPDYSEKMGIQALGRLPRLTSASETLMWFVYYPKTIEREVMKKFIHKCKSLKVVTQSKDSWTDIVPEDENLREEAGILSFVDVATNESDI